MEILDRSSLKGRLFILVVIIILLLITGSFVYHFFEGWSYVDSFYFSSISLATRGYGELHPTKTITKLFTVFYLFLGVAFILYTLSSFIGYFLQYHQPKIQRRMDKIFNSIKTKKEEKWVMIKPPKSL